MEQLLDKYLWKFVLMYMNDIIVFSKNIKGAERYKRYPVDFTNKGYPSKTHPEPEPR